MVNSPATLALRDAQMYWEPIEGEPLFDTDRFVRIREICRALEQIRGEASDSHNEIDFKVYHLVWEALRSGNLVARIIETNTVIPQVAWPEILPDDNDPDMTSGEAVWLANLWYSVLPIYDHIDDLLDVPRGGLKPFAGLLPLIEFNKAATWLAAQARARSSAESKSTGGAPNKSRAAALEYRKIYPNGHKSVGLHWVQALDAVNENLKKKGLPTIKERALQTAIKALIHAKTPRKNPTQ